MILSKRLSSKNFSRKNIQKIQKQKSKCLKPGNFFEKTDE